MSRIAIIGAMQDEISPVYDFFETTKEEKVKWLNVVKGSLGKNEYYCAQSGVSKVNAAATTQLLIDKYDVDLVIMVGVCGAIEDIDIGDCVVATKLAHHDVDPEIIIKYNSDPNYFSEYFEVDEDLVKKMKSALNRDYDFNIYFGKIVTGETFIDSDGRSEIIRKFDPYAVDMESAAVAHTCFLNRKKVVVIKSVTDTQNESGQASFEKNYEYARHKSVEVLKDLIDNIL